jgi:hypothetical protein
MLPGIAVAQTVMFQPLCGLLQQTKYLPLRYAPLDIELELADVADPVISDGLAEESSVVAGVFNASNNSTLWKIENCMVKVDLCTLDNALENSYVSNCMGGKTIGIVYSTCISSLQTVVAAETQINVSRTLSKMRSVFVSLDKASAFSCGCGHAPGGVGQNVFCSSCFFVIFAFNISKTYKLQVFVFCFQHTDIARSSFYFFRDKM